MVMDQFVTTYRKDYLWPYVKTLGIRPHPERLYQQDRNLRTPDNLCACHCLPPPDSSELTDQQRKLLGPLAYNEESWSRLGPMGPLLDPKIYPARVTAAPESKISRYNQPNVFLEKLQEKYPFIYECLRTAPPDDLLARIHKDRLRSTYQVDFCKMHEYPSAPYDELIRAAGVEGMSPCPEPVRLPGDVCKIYKQSNIASISKSGGKSCAGLHKSKTAEYCVGSSHTSSSSTAGITEYQDAISKLGYLIIRDKLHDPNRKVFQFSSK